MQAFGSELRRSEFGHLDPTVVRLNHGSYGASPRCVLEHQAALRDAQHSNPDLFLGPVLGTKMAEARMALASLMGGDAKNYALLDNATTAASTVALHIAARFQSGEYASGDRILVTRWMYDSCFKAFHHYCGSLGAVFVIIDLPGPPVGSIDEVVTAFRTALARIDDPWTAFDDRSGVNTDRFGHLPVHDHEQSPIRLACLDHIPSACPYILPLDRIVPMLREACVQEVFIDGAHVPGQLNIDIETLGVDYYTGNLHKWCYAPPAVAFLWVASTKHLETMHYPVISHAYNQGLLQESGFVGTRDYSMFAAVPSAIEFHRTVGSNAAAGAICATESAFDYTHRLITEAALMLTAAWGTKLGQPTDSCGSMMMVGLPPVVGSSLQQLGELVAELKLQYGIWTWGAGCLGDDGLLYMRLSAAVYNDLREYEKLRDAVLEISNNKTREAEDPASTGTKIVSNNIDQPKSQQRERASTKRPRCTL